MSADDAVSLVADAVAGIRAPGFGTIRTSYEDRSLVVLWSGEVPAQLQRMVDERPYDVDIQVGSVPYSRVELDAAVAAIAHAGLLKEYDIVGIDPDVITGLTIATSRAEKFSDDQIAVLRRVADVDPIQIEYAVPPATGYLAKP